MSAITTSGRLEILAGPKPRAVASFGSDVREGLAASPKRLQSKYLYDELGSALFDAITLLPEYYLTRAEMEILREWGWEMVRALGNPVEFIELGSGSAVKTRILIEEALRVQRTLRYSPIDISPEALEASARALAASFEALTVTAYAGDYFGVLETNVMRRSGPALFMFMGSNIGNYEPSAADALLSRIAASLKPEDGLLLGVDLKKDPRVLELAYDDPAGVTAAFNKNLLGRINRELGGAFDLTAFEHVARYDAAAGAVRSYLEARRAHEVPIRGIGARAAFERGERIHTESSYKFSMEDVEQLAARSSLVPARTWSDREERFCVVLLRRA